MVSIALVSSTMVIKVILIHTTCMNGEADYCHLVSMYAYMHLAFKELILASAPPLQLPSRADAHFCLVRNAGEF